jgi:hypothetical protein
MTRPGPPRWDLCFYMWICNLMGRVLNINLPASVTHLCVTEAHCYTVFGLCENRQIGDKWSDSCHARIASISSSLIRLYGCSVLCPPYVGSIESHVLKLIHKVKKNDAPTSKPHVVIQKWR